MSDARLSRSVGDVRAVSLDMWFTAFLRTPELDRTWEDGRRRELVASITTVDGAGVPSDRVLTADQELQRRLGAAHLNRDLVPPARYLEGVAALSGGVVRAPLDEAGRRYSLAGFDRAPPTPNPQLRSLHLELDRRGLPLVLTTNTHRSGKALADFFAERGEGYFTAVATSCDAGARKPDPRALRYAAELVGIPPASFLHVGDRFDSDVVGAEAAGMVPALYTGWWDRYAHEMEERVVRDDPSRTPKPLTVPHGEDLLELVERFLR
jgi:FMN phosphatase YigB (HAD superfamily)